MAELLRYQSHINFILISETNRGAGSPFEGGIMEDCTEFFWR